MKVGDLHLTKDELRLIRWSINEFGDGESVFFLRKVKQFDIDRVRSYLARLTYSRDGNAKAAALARRIQMKVWQATGDRRAEKHR